MSRSMGGHRWLAAGAAGLLVLVAAHAGPAQGTSAISSRCGQLRPTTPVQVVSGTAAAPAAIEDAAGGWRPKRPKLCGSTILLTVLVGAVMSGTPGGSILGACLMAPLLIEACS